MKRLRPQRCMKLLKAKARGPGQIQKLLGDKVIYIRLDIMIHLNDNVSNFDLVSKKKFTKIKLKSRQKGNILYQVFMVYWIGHWSFTWEVWVQSLATPLLLFLYPYFVSFFYSKFPTISNLQLIQELETRALARLTKKCLLMKTS